MEKILVVEDAQSVREEICDILQMEGFEVSAASNGFEGLMQTKNDKPDLIISDIMMPGLDGYQLVNEIKKYPDTNSIPVIFLSAKAQLDDIRTGMNLGVEDYITKPIHPNDLLAAVNMSLDKQKKMNRNISKLILSPIELLPQELSESINVVLGFSNYLSSEKSDIPKNELELLVNGIYNQGEKINKLINDYLLYMNLITHRAQSNDINVSSLKFIHLYIKSIVSTVAEELNRKNDVIFDLQEANLNFNDFYFQKIIEEIIRCSVQLTSPGSKIYVRSVIENNFYCLNIEGELNKSQNTENKYNISSCKKSIEIIELIAKNYSGDFKYNFNSDTGFCFTYYFKL
ncbi:MAG: response regulator [Bacteroidales bacterium]|nr:response regulator [Bacteroidales bacterium]